MSSAIKQPWVTTTSAMVPVSMACHAEWYVLFIWSPSAALKCSAPTDTFWGSRYSKNSKPLQGKWNWHFLLPHDSGKKTKLTKHSLSKWRGYVLQTVVAGKYVVGENQSTFHIWHCVPHSWGYITFSIHYTLTGWDLNTYIIAWSQTSHYFRVTMNRHMIIKSRWQWCWKEYMLGRWNMEKYTADLKVLFCAQHPHMHFLLWLDNWHIKGNPYEHEVSCEKRI